MQQQRSSYRNLILVWGTVCLVLTACQEPSLDGTKRQAPIRQPVTRGEPIQPRGPLVAFLGDSITAGLGVSEEQAFPAAAAALLAEQGIAIQPLNAGVSGDTSTGGLSRIDWLLRAHPAVLVVELGGNDALRGQPVASIERNLRKVIDRALGAGTVVLLLGMQIPPSYGAEYTAGFQAVYARIARDKDVVFVPAFLSGVGCVASLNQADGIHPNALGHRRLAKRLIEPLEEALDRVRSPIR